MKQKDDRPSYNFTPITSATKVFAATHIPMEMKVRPQWCYCAGTDPASQDYRRPRNPLGGAWASTKDPRTWGTYDQAMWVLQNDPTAHSIGFVFTKDDPFIGIDVDEKHPDQLTAAAKQAHDELLNLCKGTYVEMSHSGTGYHAVFRGDKTGAPGKYQSHNDKHMLELFFHGCFLRMSGCQWQGYPNSVAQDDTFVRALIDRVQSASPSGAMENVEIHSSFTQAEWAEYGALFNQAHIIDLAQVRNDGEDQSRVDLQLAMDVCRICPNDGLVLSFIRSTPRGQRLKRGKPRWTDGYAARTIGHARLRLRDAPPLMSMEQFAILQANSRMAMEREQAALKVPTTHVPADYVAPPAPETAEALKGFDDIRWPAPFPGPMDNLYRIFLNNCQAYQPEMALAAALSAMAAAVSPRVVSPTGCSTALYMLIFAPTGSGKGEIMRLLDGALAPNASNSTQPAFPRVEVVHDIASREGLESMWETGRALLWRKDEIAEYIAVNERDPIRGNIKEMLLQDFGHAPDTARKPRARSVGRGVKPLPPVMDSPLSLLGTCVMNDVVDALAQANVAKGLANRMLFIPGREVRVQATASMRERWTYAGHLLPIPGMGRLSMRWGDGARELGAAAELRWLEQYSTQDSELFARVGELFIRVATVVAAQDPLNTMFQEQASGAPLWFVQPAHVQWAVQFCDCCFEVVARLSTNCVGTQDAKDAAMVEQAMRDMLAGKTKGMDNRASIAKYAARGLVTKKVLHNVCTNRKLAAKSYELAVKFLINGGRLQPVTLPASPDTGNKMLDCYVLAQEV